MKIDIQKSIWENHIELRMIDNISGLDIMSVEITKDNFFNMFVKNHWYLRCEWDFYDKNIKNLWKSRDFKYLDYPSWTWSYKLRIEFVKNNTPEWYEYYWDDNYWRTAVFISFI